MPKPDELFWADQLAEKVVKERGRRKQYVVASRITPSGVIHIGNFREPMTAHLVKLALERKGHNTVHVHSWDDFDRFRKVPANVPKNWEQHIGMPVCRVPDPHGCHASYARHFADPFEQDMKRAGVAPLILRESERYTSGAYAKEIRAALRSREQLRSIFDHHRTTPLAASWFPLSVYCTQCGKDSTTVERYDEEYTIAYRCTCGHAATIDFRKEPIVKLPWRIDWPMRWHYDHVDFEAAGKEHMTKGGSRTTGNEIIKSVWKDTPPVEKKYEFIILKGIGGKMSGSRGNVISLGEVLNVYAPAVTRFLFAGSRPESEFAISFDVDVLQQYGYHDQNERIYFGEEEATNEKEAANRKRIYELSNPWKPKTMPFQSSFRHLTTVLQTYEHDMARVEASYAQHLKTAYDRAQLATRATAAWHWLQHHAPESFRFTVQDALPDVELSEAQREALRELATLLQERTWDEEMLNHELYEIAKRHKLSSKDFFKGGYLVLLNKEKGPKLAPFLLLLGERATKLLGQV